MGDRNAHLRAAVKLLEEDQDITVKKISSLYESEPVGPVKQRNFYNIAVEIETDQSPEELLKTCQYIEKKLKREKTVRWGPRTIDLDILLYDSEKVDLRHLKIPHPEMTKRAFVLVPLLEIAPEATVPFGEPLQRHLLLLPAESYPTKIGSLKF